MSVVNADHARNEPARRRLKGPARRARILDAACEVFARHGYDATSVEEIALAGGISRAVFYDHFPSKKHAYLAVVERERDELLRHVVFELQADLPASERMRRSIESFFSYVEDHPDAWRVLFRETAGDADVIDAQRQIQLEANAAGAFVLANEPAARTLRGGKRAATLEMVSEIVGSALNGLARWWYERRGEVSREEVVQAAMDVLWAGLERLSVGERYRRKPATRGGSSTGEQPPG